MTDTPLARFQDLLRELFQFDCADLDFGIYRILNHKRDVIRGFIEEDLPKSVEAELKRGQVADQARAAEKLEEQAQQVHSTLGAGALGADGELQSAYRETPVGRKYLEAQEAARGARSAAAMEAEAFNHLYRFLSRYYEDGDFISKRRYSKEHRYAIPYNGEEVLLHWATADQYYIKSAEHFRDYQFRNRTGVIVRFVLQEADVEHDNVKGDRRFFSARDTEASWDQGARCLVVPFDYRPLTAAEQTRYGASQAKAQSQLLDRARVAIRQAASAHPECMAALDEPRLVGLTGKTETLLDYHLRQYTRRNSSDFFIHKDLSGFLTRELDFYVKNEVLSLETLQAAGEERAEGWFQMMRLLRSVGARIIAFLAQIEDFQKMLWEKRKFVVETNYIITVGQIPDEFHAEIAATDSQWDEWRELLKCDIPSSGRRAFLAEHPTLPVDTKNFSTGFVDRVLAACGDLSELRDGLLIHGDNFQALALTARSHRKRIDCVYIDPPYNTGDSEIIYKNRYLRSSWLTLMSNRLHFVRDLVSDDPVLFVAIDDFEMPNLAKLLDTEHPELRREVIIVNHHPQGGKATTLSHTHEYMFACVKESSSRRLVGPSPKTESEKRPFRRSGTAESNFRRKRPNSFYAILFDRDSLRVVGAEPPVPLGDTYPTGDTDSGYKRIYPIGTNGTERVWRKAYGSIHDLISRAKLVVRNGSTVYQDISPDESSTALFSNWVDARYNAGTHGANLLREIIGEQNVFSYPKSVHTVRDALYSAGLKDGSEVIDFFAGSGTTAHATINLNREDGRRRKFTLVEVGDHFDEVLMQRLKKIIYAPEWKSGRPHRVPSAEESERTPRVVQYLRIESYEDALDNMAFEQQARHLPFDDYELRYMLTTETGGSNTLLNVRKLSRPFDYRLSIRTHGRAERRAVDLPETFNFLIGLRVRTRLALYRERDDGTHRYLVLRGKTQAGKETVVIWRDIEGWTAEDFEQEWEWVQQQELTEGAEVVYVNGDSAIGGACSLDPEFKRRMFEGVTA